MGLGKTVQAAVFIATARNAGIMRGPALIVAPLTTVPNWANEMRRWCPDLNCVTYTGPVGRCKLDPGLEPLGYKF